MDIALEVLFNPLPLPLMRFLEFFLISQSVKSSVGQKEVLPVKWTKRGLFKVVTGSPILFAFSPVGFLYLVHDGDNQVQESLPKPELVISDSVLWSSHFLSRTGNAEGFTTFRTVATSLGSGEGITAPGLPWTLLP